MQATRSQLTTGSSSITMKKDGTITIKGMKITIEGTQKIEEKAAQISSEAQTKNEMKGAMVTVEASGNQHNQGRPGEDKLSGRASLAVHGFDSRWQRWRRGDCLSSLRARNGPWEVFARIRSVAGRVALGRALGCVKCVSVWFAVLSRWFVGGSPRTDVVAWLGLSGVAALIDECTRPPFEWKEESQNELLRANPGPRH